MADRPIFSFRAELHDKIIRHILRTYSTKFDRFYVRTYFGIHESFQANDNIFLHIFSSSAVGNLIWSIIPGKQTALVRRRLMKTLSVLPKQFDISFDFKATKWMGGWTSILHLTTGANCCGIGQRIPAIFPLNGKLAISFAVDRNGNYYFWTPKLALNTWYNFRLTQQLVGKNYIYRVYMNNRIIHTKVNKNARDYKNVKVYVADPWYNAQPGLVKNIRISGKLKLFLPN